MKLSQEIREGIMDGWSGDAAALGSDLAEKAADEIDRQDAIIADFLALYERLSNARTTVQGTEMDAVLGPEYRLHGIHFNKLEELVRKVRAPSP